MTRRHRRSRQRDADYTGTVGEFTREVLDKYHVSSGVHAHQLITDWDEIVGSRVAARATPMNAGAAMADGVLSVRVVNSAWLQELSFIKVQLLARINEYVGTRDKPRPIHDIRFFHGRGPKGREAELHQARAQQRREKLRRRSLPAPASGQKLAEIERETAAVEDEELRAAIIEARRLLDV